jgi:hypothetical protein
MHNKKSALLKRGSLNRIKERMSINVNIIKFFLNKTKNH